MCQGWPELGGFLIAGTLRAKLWPWHRLGRGKLYDCPRGLSEFRLAKVVVDVRGIYGQRGLQLANAAELARRIKPSTATAASVWAIIKACGEVSVLVVHIRRGDSTVSDGEAFQAGYTGQQAGHVWWCRGVMRETLQVRPDTRLFLAYNGGCEVLEEIEKAFSVIYSDRKFRYVNQTPGHRSLADSVVDLFAQACCRAVIAAPRSSFSHRVASWLGEAALVLLPAGEPFTWRPSVGVGVFQGKELTTLNILGLAGLHPPPSVYMS